MEHTQNKQRTIAQIMADADLLDRARHDHERDLPARDRATRLDFLRYMLDPRMIHA